MVSRKWKSKANRFYFIELWVIKIFQKILLQTKIALDPVVCDMRSNLDHLVKVKVTNMKSAYFLSGSYFFFYRETSEFLSFYKYYLWPEVLSWTWPKVFWASFGSLAGKMQNSCPVPIFFMKFVQGSLKKVQCHQKKRL